MEYKMSTAISKVTITKHQAEIARMTKNSGQTLDFLLQNPEYTINFINSRLNSRNQPYSNQTYRDSYRALRFFNPVDTEYNQLFTHEYDRLTLLINRKYIMNTTDSALALPSWESYTINALQRFGKDSKEWLLICLYTELPCRDDYSKMYLGRQDSGNYIYRGPDFIYTIVLTDYKTAKRYGTIIKHLTKNTSDLVLKYIIKGLFKPNDYLFGKDVSTFIGFMNDKLGVPGCINTIRKMIATMTNYDDADSILDAARNMMHSPAIHMLYQRKIESKPKPLSGPPSEVSGFHETNGEPSGQ